MKLRIIAAALITTLLSFSTAAWAKDEGIYIGASAGVAEVNREEFSFDDDFDIDDEDDDFAWKAYAGYQFNGWFAIEGGYIDFGQPVFTFAEADIDGYNLSLIAGIPLGPIRVFAKGGVIAWDAEIDAGDGGFGDFDDDGTDLGAGVGLEFELFSIGIRAEVEYFDFADEVYLATLGATYTF